MKRQSLTTDAMCQICRVDKQTGHHAMVGCPKVVALRFEMRKHWLLSDEKQFCYTGPDWLLMSTSLFDDALKAKSVAAILAGLASAEINDMIHDKELHQLDGSTNFLVNYSKS
jgi:hypothetical protein